MTEIIRKPGTMRGTDEAALATHWTETRAGYVDDIYEEGAHRSYLFPDLGSNIDLTCVFTSGEIDAYGTWAEVTDSGTTTFSSVITSSGGHITALRVRSTSVDDVMYVIELGYGLNTGAVTVFNIHDFGAGTKKIDSDQQIRFRPPLIPSGQKVYYRMKTENNANATANIGLRYHPHS